MTARAEQAEQGVATPPAEEQRSAAAPSEEHSGGIASAVGMFAGFVPWIAYWALIGSVSFRLAVLIAFALSVAISGATFLRSRQAHVLEIGATAVFLVLLVVTFSTDDTFLERWIQPLTNSGLFLIALGSLLISRPFTLDYARAAVPPEVARKPGFLFINRVITIVWTVAFALMTIAAAVPPIVEGEATIREGASTLSIIGYWVAPFTFIGLAALFSSKFPDWFVARLDAPHEAAATQATPLPRTEHPTERGIELSVDTQGGDGGENAASLLDQPLAPVLRGAPPGAEVTFAARTIDALGRSWASEATLRADESGVADLVRTGPESGTYSGRDPSGLVWSMRPADPATDLYVPSIDAATFSISARCGEAEVSRIVARAARGPGVEATDVGTGDVRGRLFLPPGADGVPGVAVYGGSEGGIDSMSQTAALLASHGYAAFVVGYFGLEGLDDHLVEIPLERLAGGLRWLAGHRAVDSARVGGLAISKGAEGLLAAAAAMPGLSLGALVAISPSHVAWQAVGDDGPVPETSSWTLAGQPVSFCEMRGEALMPEMLRNAVLGGLDRRRHRPTLLHLGAAYPFSEDANDAALAVERILAPVMCVVGDADEIWHSSAMAGEIIARRQDAGAGSEDEICEYEGAGHLIRPPLIPTTSAWTEGIAFGGTPEGLAHAQSDSWQRILGFLGCHLDGEGPATEPG